MTLTAFFPHRIFGIWVMLLAFTAAINPAGARLEGPTGQVLLTVEGAISAVNAGNSANFDRAMLAALPQHEVRTSTEWTDGVKRFEGPLLRDVLAQTGARGSVVLATAVNDYSVEIPLHETKDYPVILAMRMDGEELTLRNKGPLWVVYPRDDYSELQNPEMNSRWIWQLRTLEVR